MAMEDAVALSGAIAASPSHLAAALEAYEQAAQPSVVKIQDSARPSLAWWEHFGRYHDEFEPWQFAYHFMSRSITDARLARRDRDWVEASHRAWVRAHGAEPLETPFQHQEWAVSGRMVTLASSAEGVPSAVLGGAEPLPLADRPLPGRWGAVLAAPQSEAGLPEAHARLAQFASLDVPPVLVAVHGGTLLTRTLLCEQARMHERIAALLVDPEIVDDETGRDRALTTVLSGRADLVGVSR
jgi:anthraniloyl-CoA monooxygenase